MAKTVKVNDPVTDAMNNYYGKIDEDLGDAIADLMSERINLADMLASMMTTSRFFENVKVDVNINPEFPTVYFFVRERTGKQMSASALIIQANGHIKPDLSAPSDIRDAVRGQLIELANSKMIKKQVEKVKELASEVMTMLRERNGDSEIQ